MKPHFPLFLCFTLAACGDSKAPEISVHDAWARATLTAAQPAAVYMRISNGGTEADRLTAVASPGARASLHVSSLENGVTSMRPLAEGLTVAAGETVELKPQGTHVMLEGLGAPLQSGATLPLTLQFAKSGELQVQVRIADGSPESHSGH